MFHWNKLLVLGWNDVNPLPSKVYYYQSQDDKWLNNIFINCNYLSSTLPCYSTKLNLSQQRVIWNKRHTAKISMLYTPSIVSALINFSIEDIIQINQVKYKENTET